MAYTKEQIRRAMTIMGSLGGKKGGVARAAALSPERRKEISMLGVKARAAKYPKVEKPVKPRGKPGRPRKNSI